MIHNSRKSVGDDGADVRGSSAIPANVDVCVSFKRDRHGPDTRRIMDAISRDRATPGKLIVAYTDSGDYVALGTAAEVRDREHTEQLLEAITDTPQTYEELRDSSELGLRTVKRLANQLHKDESLTGKAKENEETHTDSFGVNQGHDHR